jgi:phosphatidylserine/phosphatidylglycerophosphate/cardiolipin synthase-like enzyme
MFKYILYIFLCTSLFANEAILTISQNQTLFLPQQSEEAKDKIIELIRSSKVNIKISMYNFSYKKFAKELVIASKNGINVQLILDNKKIEEDNDIYKYFKKNGIKIILPKKKVHTKIAIFDNKVALIGSLNWTKESFEDNYEILLISYDKKVIEQIDNFINNLN